MSSPHFKVTHIHPKHINKAEIRYHRMNKTSVSTYTKAKHFLNWMGIRDSWSPLNYYYWRDFFSNAIICVLCYPGFASYMKIDTGMWFAFVKMSQIIKPERHGCHSLPPTHVGTHISYRWLGGRGWSQNQWYKDIFITVSTVKPIVGFLVELLDEHIMYMLVARRQQVFSCQRLVLF